MARNLYYFKHLMESCDGYKSEMSVRWCHLEICEGFLDAGCKQCWKARLEKNLVQISLQPQFISSAQTAIIRGRASLALWLTIRLMPPIMVMSPEKAHRGYLTQPFGLRTSWQSDSNASEVSYIMWQRKQNMLVLWNTFVLVSFLLHH